MFSSALRSRSDVIAWGITPIDWRTSLGKRRTSKVLTRAVPEVGSSSVVNMRISVDLPAPFGPSSPKISPCSTLNVTWSTAVNSPKRLVISSTSMAARPGLGPVVGDAFSGDIASHQFSVFSIRARGGAFRRLLTADCLLPTVSQQGQRDIGREPRVEPAFAVVHAQADFESLDVALGPAHVALGGVSGVHAPEEDGALAFHTRRKADAHTVAQANPIDVGFFDVGADPKIVRVDQGHDGLARVDHLPLECGSLRHQAVDRGADFGVSEADLRLLLLGASRRQLVLLRAQLAAPDR